MRCRAAVKGFFLNKRSSSIYLVQNAIRGLKLRANERNNNKKFDKNPLQTLGNMGAQFTNILKCMLVDKACPLGIS